MKTKAKTSQSPWWNRPLWGNQSFWAWFQFILRKGIIIRKDEIPETTISLYRQSFNSLKNISRIMYGIDNDKFTSREFVNFLMINRQIENSDGAYEGLKYSIDLLRVALETKDSFLKIEATESLYRSYAQQEFYEYVFELLAKNLEVNQFKQLVERQSINIIDKIKSDEGKIAIQSYINQLDIVCKDKIGLKLLFLFKQYDSSNFSLVRNVAEIADSFYDKNLETIKELIFAVQVNVDMFLKLGQIILIPENKNKPETYALMLQYIALRNRHLKSFGEFQSLLELLKQWEKFYNPLITIRQEYPPEEFKQPAIFAEKIPGIELYNKYQTQIN